MDGLETCETHKYHDSKIIWNNYGSLWKYNILCIPYVILNILTCIRFETLNHTWFKAPFYKFFS